MSILDWLTGNHPSNARIYHLETENAQARRILEIKIDEIAKLESDNVKLRADLARVEAGSSNAGMTIVALREQLAAANKRIAAHKEELDAEEARLRAQLGFVPILDRAKQIDAGNDAQAARAMSRQIKGAFVEYQQAVKQILDGLDDLGKANHVTKEDLRKLRQIRIDLGHQIQRAI